LFAEKIITPKILGKRPQNNGINYVFSSKNDGIYLERSAVELVSEII
jgi:hypothetical protein